MHSTRKLTIFSLLAFLAGVGLTGTYALYTHTQQTSLLATLQMTEDLNQGTALVAHFQNGNPEYAYDILKLVLESNCEFYTSSVNEGYIDPELVQRHIKRAQEATGLCQDKD